MLDLALFAFLFAALALGFRRPWLWVPAYLYIDILSPQKIGWSLTGSIPVSLIAFVLAFAGWLLADPKVGSRFTWRQGALLFLLVYCAWTTAYADFPENAAEKWAWVWKALVFAIFLPLTLTTRLRIEGTALVMVLTAAAIVISGGMKTLGGGGGYGGLRLFVDDNTGLYESSTLSTAAVAIIPLAVWLARHGTVFRPDWRVKLFAAGLILACLLIPIGTEARTGLLCIGALAVLMLRDVKRRFVYLGLAGALATLAVPFLPASYTERMATISGHDGDESASTRVAVWRWTLDYAAEHPLGGGFDAYRGNSFTYRLPKRTGEGNNVSVTYEEVTDHARAYHSSVFEMLGEQGWPGLIVWLIFQAGGLWQMERLRRRARRKVGKGAPLPWDASLASALQAAQVVFLVGALFQGIAYQPFFLMIFGLQIGLYTWCLRRDSEQAAPRRRVAPASPAGAAAMP